MGSQEDLCGIPKRTYVGSSRRPAWAPQEDLCGLPKKTYVGSWAPKEDLCVLPKKSYTIFQVKWHNMSVGRKFSDCHF